MSDEPRSAPPRLAELAWPEAAEWFRRDPRLLVPVGTCLQHGPHLPLGTDTIIIERLCEEIASRFGVLLAPTIPYGVVSRRERDYAGTASLLRKTLHGVLNELVADWERHGLQEVMLMTAHGYGPHLQALATVVARLRIRAVDLHAVDLTGFLAAPHAAEHAGELETSLLLHLAPELVRRETIADGAPARPGAGTDIMGDVQPVPPPGSSGVVGRPTLSSAEKGEAIFEHLVSFLGEHLAAGTDVAS